MSPPRRFLARLATVAAAAPILTVFLAGAGPLPQTGGIIGLADPAPPTLDFTKPEPGEIAQGGATTSRKHVNRDSFSQSSANMSFEKELNFKIGNGFFRRIWVTAPSSTASADGLGPLFNAKSCQHCHLKDGRGHTPAGNSPADDAVSMFLRISIPPQTEADRAALKARRVSVIPDPVYGTQIQDFAIPGLAAEGHMTIDYTDVPVRLGDGSVVTLRKPQYSVTDLGFGPLHPQAMLSPRVAPQMIGLGLLEAIDEKHILMGVDPDDKDGNGISGRANWVWSAEQGKVVLGRFGWKAGQPSITEQSAGAFNGDIGLSTPLTPDAAGDCTEAQTACRGAPNGNSAEDGLEVSAKVLDLVTFYSRNLAVPARRDVDDPQVLAGKKAFYRSGCIACHRPKYVTREDPALPEQSGQLIWPYTDMLLHDMGDGLADGRPEGDATGREWRTPPLWGVGLTATVSDHTQFLHDGRARTLLEAILWHGGEAEAATRKVVEMDKETRAALIRFLESL